MLSRYLSAVGAICLLLGCASTGTVRDLADKTAANIGTIGVHLRRLDANSRDLADRRASNISRLHAANAKLRASYEYDVALTRKSGAGSNLSLLDDIEAWRTKVDAIFEQANQAQVAHKQDVLASQSKLDSKSQALTEIAQALASLAEEDKPSDRVRFLAGYAISLREELETALETDTQASNAAGQLLEEAGAALDSEN